MKEILLNYIILSINYIFYQGKTEMPAHEREVMQAKSGDEDFTMVRGNGLREHSGGNKLIYEVAAYLCRYWRSSRAILRYSLRVFSIAQSTTARQVPL